MPVGIGRAFSDVFDEASLELPFQYFILVVEKCPGAFADKQPDDRRTQVGNLLIRVVYNLERVGYMSLALIWEVGQQLVLRFLRVNNLQFVGIFDVHHLLTDVVFRFYKIDKRVACVSQGRTVELLHAQFLGYPPEALFFGGEEAELGLLSCQAR